MSDVKRYDPINKDGTCGVCIEDADYGAYVEYADYAALEAELAKLRAGQDPVAIVKGDGSLGAKLPVGTKLFTTPQPRIQFGAYGVELTENQWDQINQAAFELGGTDDGEYCLAPEDLSDLVSQVFVILGFTDVYKSNLPAPSPSAPATVQHTDDAAVDRFAAVMKAKLAKSRDKGRHGWQNCTAPHLSAMLYDHLYKADPVDVANFAMMLHQNGQCIELPQHARGNRQATVQGVNQQLLEALTDSLELMETLCAFEGDTIRKARAAIAAARKEGGKV